MEEDMEVKRPGFSLGAKGMEAEIEIDLSISAYPLTSQAFIPSKQVLSVLLVCASR